MNYETIKALAKQSGYHVQDLIALAPQNDPFYTGRPSEIEGAQWFASIWQRFGYGSGVHLRRVHYQLVSQSPAVRMPHGKPYENTTNSWSYLNEASKWARYLGLVDASAFVDRRNPDAIVTANYEYEESSLSYGVNRVDESWPIIGDIHIAHLDALPQPPRLDASGYEWLLPPIHLEVWVEKTTMNDVLLPVCQRENVNLVTGAGELSITSVLQFMGRVSQASRPARILYISDFDPAGMGMPISIARKVEYFQRDNPDYAELDIRLIPIALTTDQVQHYRLPRIPVKDSDLRKGNWERDFGNGAVELDALEALHPGVLRRLVTDYIEQHRDRTWMSKVWALRNNLQDELNIRHAEIVLDNQDEINSIQEQYNHLEARYEQVRRRLESIIGRFSPRLNILRSELDRLTERAGVLYDAIAEQLEDVDVDMEPYDMPAVMIEEIDNPLYDSERDYIEQIEAYKQHRHNGNGAF